MELVIILAVLTVCAFYFAVRAQRRGSRRRRRPFVLGRRYALLGTLLGLAAIYSYIDLLIKASG